MADTPVYFASVHVSTEDHQKNLRAVINTLSPELRGRRFVVGGDFNAARHYDEVYKKNVYGWSFESLATNGFHDCHFGLHAKEVQSFWGRQAKEAYQDDHFFVSKTDVASVLDCRIIDNSDTRRLNDHGPIILHLA